MARLYSKEGQEKIRLSGLARWLERAREKWGAKYEYSIAQDQYQTQKSPLVTLKCPKHGQFKTTPEQHLVTKSAGCKLCGNELKALAKTTLYHQQYVDWIENDFPDHLEPIGRFVDPNTPYKVRCRVHNVVKEVLLVQLKSSGYGCDKCAREGTLIDKLVTKEKLISELSSKLPVNISIKEIQRLAGTRVLVNCKTHGDFYTNVSTLRHGIHICRKCWRITAGYTSIQLERLITAGERGRPTWLGVMEVEVFGITSLKIGVTVRTLEERYKWHLKEIFYAVQLDEVDAYTLEARADRAFQEYADVRILNAGMRKGKRWGGDTELFWPKMRDRIVRSIKAEVKDLEHSLPDYDSELELIQKMVREHEIVERDKSLRTQPVKVFGIDTDSLSVVVMFDSIAEAKRNGYHNVSLVLSGHRLRTGGLFWIKADENITEEEIEGQLHTAQSHLKDTIVHRIRDARSYPNCIPVYCIERNQHFHSTVEAEVFLRTLDVSISASKITSACKGNRPMSGGYHWRYSDISHEQIDSLDAESVLDAPPMALSNSAIKVIATNAETGEEIGIFKSNSEAARQTGLSGGSLVKRSIKTGKPIKGVIFRLYS